MNFSEKQQENLVFHCEDFSLFVEKTQTFKLFSSKSSQVFEQERVFFEELLKEPHLPSIFPLLRDSSQNCLVFCEEISCSLADFLRKQQKMLPFSEVFSFFKAILHGFCFLKALKTEVSLINIEDFFVTRGKELKLLSFRSKNCKESDKFLESASFCAILLEILTQNCRKSRENLAETDFSAEIQAIEETYTQKIDEKNAKERENFEKLLKILKKVLIKRKKTWDILQIFSQTLAFPHKTALKSMILLEDGDFS